MARPSRRLLLACAIGLLAAPARGEDQDLLLRRIDELERRVLELEAERASAGGYGPRPVPGSATDASSLDWTRWVRLSGSANTGYYDGSDASVGPDGSFAVGDARFFVDAELASDVERGDTFLFRSAGMSFEWNLVRLGELENDVGELYGEFQGIADSSWLNLQLGRFQIPVGEAYLRYSGVTGISPSSRIPSGVPGGGTRA